MATPIKQLHDNKNNSDFYPWTHADAVIGLEEKIQQTGAGVTVTDEMEENNYNPISSHGVYTVVGNIKTILETI